MRTANIEPTWLDERGREEDSKQWLDGGANNHMKYMVNLAVEVTEAWLKGGSRMPAEFDVSRKI